MTFLSIITCQFISNIKADIFVFFSSKRKAVTYVLKREKKDLPLFYLSSAKRKEEEKMKNLNDFKEIKFKECFSEE